MTKKRNNSQNEIDSKRDDEEFLKIEDEIEQELEDVMVGGASTTVETTPGLGDALGLGQKGKTKINDTAAIPPELLDAIKTALKEKNIEIDEQINFNTVDTVGKFRAFIKELFNNDKIKLFIIIKNTVFNFVFSLFNQNFENIRQNMFNIIKTKEKDFQNKAKKILSKKAAKAKAAKAEEAEEAEEARIAAANLAMEEYKAISTSIQTHIELLSEEQKVVVEDILQELVFQGKITSDNITTFPAVNYDGISVNPYNQYYQYYNAILQAIKDGLGVTAAAAAAAEAKNGMISSLIVEANKTPLDYQKINTLLEQLSDYPIRLCEIFLYEKEIEAGEDNLAIALGLLNGGVIDVEEEIKTLTAEIKAVEAADAGGTVEEKEAAAEKLKELNQRLANLNETKNINKLGGIKTTVEQILQKCSEIQIVSTYSGNLNIVDMAEILLKYSSDTPKTAEAAAPGAAPKTAPKTGETGAAAGAEPTSKIEACKEQAGKVLVELESVSSDTDEVKGYKPILGLIKVPDEGDSSLIDEFLGKVIAKMNAEKEFKQSMAAFKKSLYGAGTAGGVKVTEEALKAKVGLLISARENAFTEAQKIPNVENDLLQAEIVVLDSERNVLNAEIELISAEAKLNKILSNPRNTPPGNAPPRNDSTYTTAVKSANLEVEKHSKIVLKHRLEAQATRLNARGQTTEAGAIRLEIEAINFEIQALKNPEGEDADKLRAQAQGKRLEAEAAENPAQAAQLTAQAEELRADAAKLRTDAAQLRAGAKGGGIKSKKRFNKKKRNNNLKTKKNKKQKKITNTAKNNFLHKYIKSKK